LEDNGFIIVIAVITILHSYIIIEELIVVFHITVLYYNTGCYAFL